MTNTEAQRLWDYVSEHLDQGTVWEIDFLETIANRIEAGQDLSPGQGEKLTELAGRWQ